MLSRVISALIVAVLLGLGTASTTQGAASRTVYQASWARGLAGWAHGGPAWTTGGGMLSYSGADASSLLAPVKVPGGSYAVEARIRLLAWKDTGVSENHGFGILVRSKGAVDPTAGTAGLMVGIGRGFMGCDGVYSQALVATADTDLSSLKSKNPALEPGHTWHAYRVEVRGNTMKIIVDGRLRSTVTTSRFAGASGVGLFSLSAQLQVKTFTVERL